MKTFTQHDSQDCGLACLKTILYKKNIEATIPRLRELTKTTQNGTSMLDMVEVSYKYGLEAFGLKGSLEEFLSSINDNEIKLPIIAHIAKGEGMLHYIVIIKKISTGFFIFDPSEGKQKVSFEQFKNQWTGYVINFGSKIGSEFEETKKEKYQFYLSILTIYKFKFLKIIFYLMLASGIAVTIPIFLKRIIDSSLAESKDLIKDVDVFFIVVFFITIIIFQLVINILSEKNTEKLNLEIREKLFYTYFETLVKLPLNFFNNRNTGDILMRLSDLEEVTLFLSFTIPKFISDLFLSLFMGVLLFKINLMLFSVSFTIVVLYLCMVSLYRTKIKYFHKKFKENYSSLNSKFKEIIDGMETIKSLTLEKAMVNQLFFKSKSLNFNNYKLQLQFGYLSNNIVSLELVGLLTLLLIGINLVNQQLISVGTLIMFESLFYLFINPIKNIMEYLSRLPNLSNSIDRLSDIFDATTEDFLCIDKPTIGDLKWQQITCNNVDFSYSSNNKVFENLNLEIMKGKNYGIIGHSGSGKSTLMKLILSMENKDSGDIFIDNIKIENISIISLRKNILYVSQATYLFNSSLRDNLLFGTVDLDKKLFEQVLKGCHINEIMSELDITLDYMINENGWNFSGGQRQRIAIARALLKQPKYIIFDEAFNQLNSNLAEEILYFINMKFKEITVIQVTHDDKILKYSDTILTLPNL